jgi:hypothetical protein
MSTSEPPPEFVPLWPISRGPLLSGQIVRQANGELAEWFPLPEGWDVPFVSGSDPIPDGSLAVPFGTGQVGPKPAGPRDVIRFQSASDSAPGWILIPRRDDPTLDKLLAETNKPNQKAGVLRGFAAFIRSQIDKEPVLLYPALIYAPFAGLLKSDNYDLECLNYPSAKDRKAIWSDFFSAGSLGVQETSTIPANVGDDAGKYLQLADLLIRENDPDRAASFLELWASGILKAEKKRQKEKRIFWVLSVAVLGLILACALIGRFAREQFDVRVRAQREIKQNENLREEQIQSLVLWGRRMRESLPQSGLVPADEGRLGPQLSKEERKQWQDLLALASTFETQDNSEPELMMLRADAHHILGQTDQARQLVRRVASGTGPRAALACLAMSNGSLGKDGARTISEEERKGWLDQADNVLDPQDDSPFADLVRAITGFSQEAFCRENNAFPEAEKLRSESLDLVWELIETRTRERHSGLAPYALCLLLEHLDPKDRKLAKVGNLLEETIARNPAFFDLYRVKNSRLALIQRDAQTPTENLALGLACIQAVVNMAGRFPERLEKRPEEILSALDLVDESTLMVGDAPSQNGFEEIWIWAMEQTQSLLNRVPRDSNYLRLMGRAWITGARVATRISGGEGVAFDRMEKGLGIWNLLERLQGPKEELRLARARTLAEMAAFSLELGRTKQFEELDNACQTILSTMLQENPGAVVALDTHFRSRWMQALIQLSKKDIKKAKDIVSGLVNRVASFPPSRDPSDQKQVRLLLIQAKLLDLNLALRELTEKGKTNWFREWKAIRDSLTRITDEPDNREELARIRARLALLEWSIGPEPMGKSDPSKPPTKVSGTTNEILEKKAREAISQAVWEPREGRNLFSIWKVGP